MLSPQRGDDGRLPDGHVHLNVAHLGRQVTDLQRTALQWRDPCCTVQECAATFTEIDHRADWQAWCDLLDAKDVPRIALHAARNTTASLLEEAGVPARMVAEILGQATVEVTYGYQSADLERRRDAMLALEALVGE